MEDESEPSERAPYAKPQITTYGTLTDMTSSVLSSARLAAGGTLEMGSSPIGGGGELPVPPSPQGGVLPTTESGGTSSTSGVVVPGIPPGGEGVEGVQASGGFEPVGDDGSPASSESASSEGGVLGTSASGGGDGAGASAEGSLPYTGFGAAFVAALGAGLTAAGAALRRSTSRRS